MSGAPASRPQYDKAAVAPEDGDALDITTLDRLGRSTQNMLAFAEPRGQGAKLRVLHSDGEGVDTFTPMRLMVFTVMAPLAQMELGSKCERITDEVAQCRAAGKDHGGPRPTFTDSEVRSSLGLARTGEPATRVTRDLGRARATLYRRIRVLSQPNGQS